LDREEIEAIVEEIINESPSKYSSKRRYLFEVEIGASARHLHISREHLDKLFGKGYELTPLRDLKQPGQFASEETVKLITEKGEIPELRILGPVRNRTEIELSLTDAFSVGLEIHLPEGQYKDGIGGATLSGPEGEFELKSGIILQQRHLHTSQSTADKYDLNDTDIVSAKIEGPRGGIIDNILVRVGKDYADELHLDTDEANALMVKTGDRATILAGDITEKDIITTDPEKTTETTKLNEIKSNNSITPEHNFDDKLLDEEEIKSLALKGIKRIKLSKTSIVSPLALEKANSAGIEIIYPD
jgi:putative phosphotransacetylase